MEEIFGNWSVSDKGDMTFEKGNKFYYIEAKRLKSDTWISHTFQMPWCDLNDFIPAYWYAMGRAGIESIKMTVYNNETPRRKDLVVINNLNK